MKIIIKAIEIMKITSLRCMLNRIGLLEANSNHPFSVHNSRASIHENYCHKDIKNHFNRNYEHECTSYSRLQLHIPRIPSELASQSPHQPRSYIAAPKKERKERRRRKGRKKLLAPLLQPLAVHKTRAGAPRQYISPISSATAKKWRLLALPSLSLFNYKPKDKV